MSKRVSHSLLDPYMVPLVKPLYRALPIPRRFPPEGIIAVGHLLAIAAAFGFALAADYWWGGVLICIGVLGNHLADMVDGTHARATEQCRNGGELLDHFTDPLSFSYWFVGLGIGCGHWWLGTIGVLAIYATAVLTNIKAKMVGEFTLARFGPTEFKVLLALLGMALAILAAAHGETATLVLLIAAIGLDALLVLQLLVNLATSVVEVNRSGDAPDTSEWEVTK
ncbi:MAG: CDP-alcohol phosphatidyltransferase family protein [Phycisphaerales bacterium JB038]